MNKHWKAISIVAASGILMMGTMAGVAASPSSPSSSNNSVASNYTGWYSELSGRDTIWRYYQNGKMVEDQWLLSGQTWYYLGYDGVMAVGWEHVDGNDYYFTSSGAMATGWIEISLGQSASSNGPSGSKNTGTGWFYFDSTGTMASGWRFMSPSWYYFYDRDVDSTAFEDGQMLFGEVTIGDAEYYFGTEDDGTMKTGKVEVEESSSSSGPSGSKSNTRYQYYDSNGEKVISSWLYESGDWYYFDDEGDMVKGHMAVNSSDEYTNYDDKNAKYYYYMDETTGKMQTGWVTIKPGSSANTNSPTGSKTGASYDQYYNTDGSMQLGWLQLGSKWYYLATREDLATEDFKDDVLGQMAVGEKEVKDGGNLSTFYFNTNGTMVERVWKEIDSDWYYYGDGGARYEADSNDDLLLVKISNKYYAFDEEGVLLENATIYKVGNQWTAKVPTAKGTYPTYDCARSGGVATVGKDYVVE